MTIPYYEQYYYESSRNNKFGWMAYGLALVALVLYGLLTHWIQYFLRKRNQYKPTPLQRAWQWFNWSGRVPKTWLLFQPSLVLLFAVYCGINVSFCLVQTKDLTYQPWYYIVGKRTGKIAMSNTPLLYLFVTKNDVITLVTGLSHDKVNRLHRWVGRAIYCMILAHLSMTITYWLDMNFKIMLQIPPQIFGMIAFGCMTVLTFASPRFMRRISYEFFLFNHGICAGIMMLMALFHNPSARAHAILAIHTVVLDRVTSAVRSIIYKRISPTKGLGRAKVLDSEGTVEVIVPMGTIKTRWFTFGKWKPGQHVYLRMGSVRRLQWHPFTIASLASSGEIRLVMRERTGFTRAVRQKIENDHEGEQALDIKALVHGPYGGTYQPLDTFDTVIFIAGGTGGSFTFPVALSLVDKPNVKKIRVVWFCALKEHRVWYQDIIGQLTKYSHVELDICVTREKTQDDSAEVEKKMALETETETTAKKRPSVESLVDVTPLGTNTEQSVAMLACGPAGLTNDVQKEGQRLRRRGYDVYTYIERYVV